MMSDYSGWSQYVRYTICIHKRFPKITEILKHGQAANGPQRITEILKHGQAANGP